MDSAEEHRCFVRLMKMSLGLNEQAAEAFLSPTKPKSGGRLEHDNDFDNIKEEEYR